MLTKEDIRWNIAANFLHVRKQLGITGREMGERLGLSQKSYSAIEEGRASAAIHVYNLSKLINKSMDQIFTTRLK